MITRQDYLRAVGIPAVLPPDSADEELTEDFYNYVNDILYFFDEERRERMKLDIFKMLREQAHFCPICGELCTADQKIIYTRTKRKTVVFLHDECLRKELKLDD